MAFFKFRKSGDEPALAAPMTESVEAMRKRATFRLIGAVVLVLAAVIGFPMAFDNAPRPIPVDVKIEIPDKNKVAPLALPTAPNAPSAAAMVQSPAAAPAANAKSGKVEPANDEKETIVVENKKATEPKPSSKEALKEPVKEPAKEIAKPTPKAATPEDGARALALLEGQSNKVTPKPEAKPEAKADKPDAAAPAGTSRFVVQVGAFADATKAKDVRSQLEKAGLKTYTHVAETKDGARTRVRVGPFDDRATAEATAQKVKALGLPAVLLTL